MEKTNDLITSNHIGNRLKPKKDRSIIQFISAEQAAKNIETSIFPGELPSKLSSNCGSKFSGDIVKPDTIIK